jgi:branched-chain amino acid transport system ATP-binding protein
MKPLLQVQGLCHHFGGVRAVEGLELRVPQGAIHGLIGPNGSGKTTTFNLITGIYRPAGGRILLDGTDIAGRRPFSIVRRGVARTFQNLRIFHNLSVLDNVRIASPGGVRSGLLSTLLRLPGHREEEARMRAGAMSLLAFTGMALRSGEKAGNLPYGDMRRLEIARALATRPRLLLLDEPAAGMNPREVDDLVALVRRIREDLKVTVLLIEHHMRLVQELCEEVLVMDFGEGISTMSRS